MIQKVSEHLGQSVVVVESGLRRSRFNRCELSAWLSEQVDGNFRDRRRNEMPAAYRVFQVPKRGNTPDEYEDAFAANSARGRFAIADGATESSHARLWAELLVAGFVGSWSMAWEKWVPPLQADWLARVTRPDLSWYAQEKLELGAFATFLGLVLEEDQWWAVARGDACLFQVRGDERVAAFPVEQAADFGTTPQLVGSRTPVAWSEKCDLPLIGELQPGDRFLLATDAMAHWLLWRHETGDRPWSESKLPNEPDTFAAWIAGLRESGEMHNDDVTLVIIST